MRGFTIVSYDAWDCVSETADFDCVYMLSVYMLMLDCVCTLPSMNIHYFEA